MPGDLSLLKGEAIMLSMNFYDIYTRVEEETQNTTIRSNIKDWTNEILRDLNYNGFNRYLLSDAILTVSANVATCNLPTDFGMLLRVYNSVDQINVTDIDKPRGWFKDKIGGTTYKYVVTDLTSPSLIDMTTVETGGVSDIWLSGDGSATDGNISFTVVGLDKTYTRQSYVITTGATAGSGASATASLINIEYIKAGQERAGIVYLLHSAGATLDTASAYITMTAGITSIDYSGYTRKLRFYPDIQRATAADWKVLYLKEMKELIDDLDYPTIPAYAHPAIVAGTCQKAFRYMGDDTKTAYWTAEYQKWIAKIQELEGMVGENQAEEKR